ncbi:hypothetical protein PR003_g3588 [Phytophthora rubi]|uniref:Secreted protein n=1 Tax=Phytophthora rubi TaxID=129364 RepID=A0A6A3P1N0_9STRA|nr:hypothetical protein PR002_g3574 [Phytophthora rubi]KAE9047550.1 hypothetical protein PR001_g4166 [Phytophthora rubi]KAE9353988.1 hypothetical protein PR003_g3588 [Phytophthora rubi]
MGLNAFLRAWSFTFVLICQIHNRAGVPGNTFSSAFTSAKSRCVMRNCGNSMSLVSSRIRSCRNAHW